MGGRRETHQLSHDGETSNIYSLFDIDSSDAQNIKLLGNKKHLPSTILDAQSEGQAFLGTQINRHRFPTGGAGVFTQFSTSLISHFQNVKI